MKTIEIKTISRKETGKKATKHLRRKGHVPCVMYGQKEENIHFHAHKNEFRKLVYTPNSYIISLNIDDNKYDTVMKSVDFHPVTDEIMHIDFFRIDISKEFTVEVPVKTTGLSVGIQAGGVLRIARRKLAVQALAELLPDDFTLDITDLNIGDSIKVNELDEQFDKLKFLDPQSIVVAVEVTRLAKTEEELEEELEEGEEGEGEEGEAKEGEAKEGEAKAKEKTKEKK